MVLGLGMANVMAPATDSIMGSLPRAKAGVGSAVNDTTRQMGGAIGVAVLGSILASHFTSSMTDRLAGVLPAPLLDRVSDNVGSAIGIAREVPQARPFAPQIIDAANSSFVGGMQVTFTVAAVITAIAAVGVMRFLPAHARDDARVPDEIREPALALGAEL